MHCTVELDFNNAFNILSETEILDKYSICKTFEQVLSLQPERNLIAAL